MKKLILLLTLLSLTPACAYYSGGPWRGRVLDMETREPIEGAAVVAVWDIGYPTLVEYNRDYFDAKETVTDIDGKFEFPKYREIYSITNRIYDPRFFIFKPGYGKMPESVWLKEIKPKIEYKEKPFIDDSTTVLLQRLKTKEERENNVAGTDPTNGKLDHLIPHFWELINREKTLIQKGE